MHRPITPLILLLLLLLPLLTHAADLRNLTPGQLGHTIDIDPNVTTLTVSGTINAADLHYIAHRAPSLQTLDLRDATIAPYEGTPLTTNTTTHPASTLPAYILAGTTISSITLPSNLTAIGDGALMGTPIRTLAIPPTVHTIGKAALAACTSLQAITLPASIRTLAPHTLRACTSLRDVTILAPLDTLPEGTLEGCTALTALTLPDGLRVIGPRALAGTTSLSRLTLPSTLTAIAAEALLRTGLRQLDLTPAKNLHTIGPRAFAHSLALTDAILPPRATDIGQGLFFGCTSLRNATLPADLTSLPPLTLTGASSLAWLSGTLHEGIDTIGTLALAGVSKVPSLILPSTLRHIADGAMERMTSLTAINALNLREIPTLGQDVWAGLSTWNIDVIIPAEMLDYYLSLPQWDRFNYVLSGITDVTSPDPDRRISFTRDATTLTVTSSSQITSSIIYDTAGHTLARATLSSSPSTATATFDLTSIQSPLLIVSITLTDGTQTNIKIIN